VDAQILFQDHAGPDVKYVGHTKSFRDIEFRYTVPRVDPSKVLRIRTKMRNGLYPSMRRAIMNAAERARITAYMTTGDMRREFDNLCQGKLADGTEKGRPAETETDANLRVGERH
jgi:hypothetical protein